MPATSAGMTAECEATYAGNELARSGGLDRGRLFDRREQRHFSVALLSLPLMKDGAILCNSGHFDVEINLKALEAASQKVNKDVRKNVDEYVVGGKRIYLIGEGRLVNLAAAEGHPASVMDMSFSTQALASAWVVANKGKLEPRVYDVDPAIEKRVADLKLASMGVSIDTLTAEQQKYLSSWQEGT